MKTKEFNSTPASGADGEILVEVGKKYTVFFNNSEGCTSAMFTSEVKRIYQNFEEDGEKYDIEPQILFENGVTVCETLSIVFTEV